jgi:hypothetical protein
VLSSQHNAIDTVYNIAACIRGPCALCWKFQFVDISSFSKDLRVELAEKGKR